MRYLKINCGATYNINTYYKFYITHSISKKVLLK